MKLSKEQIAEIRQVKESTRVTRRPTVDAIEEVLFEPMRVLDHGFVRVVDYMGSDSAIVQAARVSYGVGTKKTSDDRGLIRYLMRHRHTTPFEMCEIKLHVKLPIFVARQWIRHRTANVNEYSARYSILDKEFYVPDLEYLKDQKKIDKAIKSAGPNQRDMFGGYSSSIEPEQLAAQSKTNKQGRDQKLSPIEAREAAKRISAESIRAYTVYRNLLGEEPEGDSHSGRLGLARELARMVLPTNYYTQWYWKIDLHNLLHFLSLRADSHAQYEIRMYAEKICEIVSMWVPITWEAFEGYRKGGVSLSAPALAVVRGMLAGETPTAADSGLSPREWRELMQVLGRGEQG